MRVGHLIRDVDPSGISGTGAVAELVEFSDGTVVLRWLGPLSTTAIHSGVASVMAIHGHGGATRIVWDPQPSASIPHQHWSWQTLTQSPGRPR